MKHRVLHVLANLGAGGAERMAVHIVLGLNRQRFEPAIVAYSGRYGSDLEQQLDQAGTRTWFLGKGPGFDWRTYHRLHRVFREFRPHIVHTHVHVMRYAFPSLVYFKPRLMVHTVNNIAECEIERAIANVKLHLRPGGFLVLVRSENNINRASIYCLRNSAWELVDQLHEHGAVAGRWPDAAACMAGNEASCAPCIPPKTVPLSCCGKNPFGTITKR